MKKKTLLGVAAAAAVGAAGWYLAAGGRKNQIEHIRREAKRLLAVRRDELAALRSAAEAGELDAGALGPVPMQSARRFSLPWCRRAVLRCGQTDLAMKSTGADGEELLIGLLMELAVKKGA